MIRIFRRLRQPKHPEKRLGKYVVYALGEIFLVVVGILIALQINNWNEERIERRKERAFLDALHQEFLLNRAQLDTVTSYHLRGLNSCNKLIALFPIDTEKANLDSISGYLKDFIYTWTFNPSQGTINAIVSTSSFEVIRDRELREILISWPDLVFDLQEDENEARAYYKSAIDPYLSKHFEYNFDFSDPRNDLKALESLEFEYLIRLRRDLLNDILISQGVMEQVGRNLDRVIELTGPE